MDDMNEEGSKEKKKIEEVKELLPAGTTFVNLASTTETLQLSQEAREHLEKVAELLDEIVVKSPDVNSPRTHMLTVATLIPLVTWELQLFMAKCMEKHYDKKELLDESDKLIEEVIELAVEEKKKHEREPEYFK